MLLSVLRCPCCAVVRMVVDVRWCLFTQMRALLFICVHVCHVCVCARMSRRARVFRLHTLLQPEDTCSVCCVRWFMLCENGVCLCLMWWRVVWVYNTRL